LTQRDVNQIPGGLVAAQGSFSDRISFHVRRIRSYRVEARAEAFLKSCLPGNVHHVIRNPSELVLCDFPRQCITTLRFTRTAPARSQPTLPNCCQILIGYCLTWAHRRTGLLGGQAMDERFTSLEDTRGIVALGEHHCGLEVSLDVLRADQRGSEPLSPRGPCHGGVLAYESGSPGVNWQIGCHGKKINSYNRCDWSNLLMRILQVFSSVRQQALNVLGPVFLIGFNAPNQKSFAKLRNTPPLFQSNLFKLCFEFLRNPER